jgi:predicted protein tyrosine phosphatase
MPFIQVCSLARLADTVSAIEASHVLTLINDRTPVTRPEVIHAERHLYIPMSDILEPMDGHILPADTHVRSVIDFATRWDREKPMVVHCYAGVSRSTAAALISVCALRPERSEREVAALIRQRSPTATPNLKLVAVADDILGRGGRLHDAAASIGRGQDCFEGVPFRLEV